MKTNHDNDTATRRLREVRKRVLSFLSGVGLHHDVRAMLFANGYSQETQDDGWARLMAANTDNVKPEEEPVVDALATLDAWNAVGLRRTRAALGSSYPDQAAYVFAGVEPAKGLEGVVVADVVLTRLEALATGSDPAREGSREADVAALALLAKRGIGAEQLAALRRVVATAKSAPEPGSATGTTRAQTLERLVAWHDEWAEVARAVVSRRDLRIRLGIASRRKRSAEEDTEKPPAPGVSPPAQVTTPTAPVTPPPVVSVTPPVLVVAAPASTSAPVSVPA